MTRVQLAPVLRHIRKLAGADPAQELSDTQLLKRFAAGREENAFAALVKRHSRLVWSVCWHVLRHQQDAEDAFQATFLLLARQAGSIRQTEAVGSWLYRVAYRVATKARMAMARRPTLEIEFSNRRAEEPHNEAAWRELQVLMHEEVNALPDKYRAPLVLCCLEGKTGPEAARQLGWKEGTLTSRLTEARRVLKRRLTRRGVLPSTILCATALGSEVGANAPVALITSTVKAGLGVGAGKGFAGLVPAKVAALVEGGLKTMSMTKLKVVMALLLAVTACAGAGALTRQALAEKAAAPPSAAAKSAEDPKERPAAKPQATNDKDSITYGGRVLGPDGRPVTGAKLYVTPPWGYLHEPSPSPEYATTGPDGRFKFAVPKAKFGDDWTVVAATAPNYGAGWVDVPLDGKRDDLTLQLVNDDVPITGQIVNLEAKPIPGVTLTVMQINAAPGEDLGPWLEAVKGKKGLSLQLMQEYLKRYTIAVPAKVTTDAEGRFRLTGIGRDRLVRARLDGPTIASQYLDILTRPEKTIAVTSSEGNPEYGMRREVTNYHGASFQYVAPPTKPIVGVVRDKDTKKPLAGVTIRSYTLAPNPIDLTDIVRTTTDAQGRYRLTGMPKGNGNKIVAIPDSDQPYVVSAKAAADSPGLDPVTVDFELKRGVWIEGKIADKVTGRPLQASVEYFSVYSNPHLRDYEGFDSAVVFRWIPAKEDGSYRVVGLPGPGLLAVFRLDHYLQAEERDDEERAIPSFLRKGQAPYHLLPWSNYGALARIDPAKAEVPIKRDVTLDPGWALKGTVLGPDDKPLAGARVLNLNSKTLLWAREGMKTAEFTGWFHPRGRRELLLRHPEKGLVGVAHPPKENGGAVTVRMESGATVTGRLVDADGKPQAGIELEVRFQGKGWGSWFGCLPGRIQTDREGRFHVGALLPGYDFRLSGDKGYVQLGGEFRSGQTKDLGDVQLKEAKK